MLRNYLSVVAESRLFRGGLKACAVAGAGLFVAEIGGWPHVNTAAAALFLYGFWRIGDWVVGLLDNSRGDRKALEGPLDDQVGVITWQGGNEGNG